MALYFAMVGAEFEVLEPAEARRRRVLWGVCDTNVGDGD